VTLPNDTPSEAPGTRPEPAPPAVAATPASARPPSPVWPAISATGASFHAWLLRPRVRLTVTGVMLLLVGGLIATNSVWTLPLVIVGALMVAVAWIGHRLEGRFAVEWGETGTRLAFDATIKAPRPTADAVPGSPPQLSGSAPEVIEGEAHTVEINVSELKALIAAAEAAEAADPTGTPDGSVRDIRIRRLTDEGARTPRPAG
jgi:hypothetical protein